MNQDGGEKRLKRLIPNFFSSGFFFGLFVLFCFVLFFVSLGLHSQVPRLGVKSELYLLAYDTATAMQDPSMSVTYTTAHGNTRSLTH